MINDNNNNNNNFCAYFELVNFIDIVLELILSSNFISLWGQVGEDPGNEMASVRKRKKSL